MEKTVCSKCGMILPDSARFCQRCGCPVVNQDIKPAGRIRGNFCPVCGTAKEPGINFCLYCGTSFDSDISFQNSGKADSMDRGDDAGQVGTSQPGNRNKKMIVTVIVVAAVVIVALIVLLAAGVFTGKSKKAQKDSYRDADDALDIIEDYLDDIYNNIDIENYGIPAD